MKLHMNRDKPAKQTHVEIPADRNVRQKQFFDWCVSSFGPSANNTQERIFRLLEEAIELAQTESIEKHDLYRLIDHVYSRPVGVPAQEVSGVALCLMAYAEHKGLSVDGCERVELERVYLKTLQDPTFFQTRQWDKVHPYGVDVGPDPELRGMTKVFSHMDTLAFYEAGPTGDKGMCCSANSSADVATDQQSKENGD